MLGVSFNSNNTDVRRQNLSSILMELLQHDDISRSHLADLTGLSNGTITNLINDLTQQNIVSEQGQIKQGIGRPQKIIQINKKARVVIGIHFDVDDINITISDLYANVIATEIIPHTRNVPWEIALESIVNTVNELIQKHSIPAEKILGVGVAASGLVNPESGVNILAPNLGWKNIPLKTYFEDRFKCPVIVDNNVRAMALYEVLFGAAKHAQTIAFVYARIGIGSGLVINRRLYHGATSGAGEIGHTTVVMDGGLQCRCGNRGCLETVFSEPVLMSQAHMLARRHPDSIIANRFAEAQRPTIDDVFMAAEQGDAAVQAMLKERATIVGVALANLINIFNAEQIILGGIFTRERGTILPLIRQVVKERSFATLGESVQLHVTRSATAIGMQGAASLALDSFFYRPMNYPDSREVAQ